MNSSEPWISELGLAAVLRQLPTAVVVVEAGSLRIVEFNDRARDMAQRQLGLSVPDSLEDWWEIFHPDGRPYALEERPVVRSMISGEEVDGEEYFSLLPDGSRLAIRSSSAAIFNEDGEVVAGVLVMDDITEQKRAEEERAYHAALLGSMLDAVIAIDLERRTVAWNTGAERMFGWSADETLGRLLPEFLRTNMDDQELAGVRRELVELGHWRGEVKVERKDGSTVWIEATNVAIPDNDGEVIGFLGIHRDIGESEERLEAERSRIARELHDGALQGLADAIALAVGPGSGSRPVGQLLPVLRNVGEQLRGAIYDLRTGTEYGSFVEVVEQLVDDHRLRAGGSEIKLELGDGIPSGSLGVEGFEVLQILGEALTNARRHAEAGHIRVRLSGANQRLWTEVSDDGLGFDPLSARSPLHTGIQGMHERAGLLGGQLEINSEPGVGTRVRLEVELTDVAVADA